jgi:hyperosmotically inducible periplasmic protein
MKFILVIVLAFASMLAFPQNSAAQDRSPEFNRSRLDRAIRKEILTLPYYGVFDAIGYQVNGSTVTLTGYVVRPTTKSDAEESVADISGVSRVINNIEVLPLSPSDDRLRARILQTLANQGGSLYRYFLGSNPSIRIIVNRGRVSLEGFADSQGDANRAYILARGVPGSFAVTNNLKVLGRVR